MRHHGRAVRQRWEAGRSLRRGCAAQRHEDPERGVGPTTTGNPVSPAPAIARCRPAASSRTPRRPGTRRSPSKARTAGGFRLTGSSTHHQGGAHSPRRPRPAGNPPATITGRSPHGPRAGAAVEPACAAGWRGRHRSRPFPAAFFLLRGSEDARDATDHHCRTVFVEPSSCPSTTNTRTLPVGTWWLTLQEDLRLEEHTTPDPASVTPGTCPRDLKDARFAIPRVPATPSRRRLSREREQDVECAQSALFRASCHRRGLRVRAASAGPSRQQPYGPTDAPPTWPARSLRPRADGCIPPSPSGSRNRLFPTRPGSAVR